MGEGREGGEGEWRGEGVEGRERGGEGGRGEGREGEGRGGRERGGREGMEGESEGVSSSLADRLHSVINTQAAVEELCS